MNKYLQIKEWSEGNTKYYYAERLGVDSIAFVLHNRDTGQFGLIKEFKPPINRFLITAFGGSLDKDIPHVLIVAEEVEEEAGYIDAQISYAGSVFVSTQMNQFCYLYLVDVTHAIIVPKKPQTAMEAMAEVVWLYPTQIIGGNDWKSITILKKMGLI